MDRQFLEKPLEESGDDWDSAIKRLNELRLTAAENVSDVSEDIAAQRSIQEHAVFILEHRGCWMIFCAYQRRYLLPYIFRFAQLITLGKKNRNQYQEGKHVHRIKIKFE